MSIFYIEDENGTYLSEDGKRKFIKLEGEKAYEYLKSKNKSKLRFFQTTTLDEKEKVFVEVPISDIQSSRKGERHKQYLDDCEKESGIVTLSIEDLPKNRDLSGEELLEDKTENTENTVFTTLELADQESEMGNINYYYNQFVSWADEFDKTPLKRKRMIADELLNQVSVAKGYEIQILMNASYQQFFAY